MALSWWIRRNRTENPRAFRSAPFVKGERLHRTWRRNVETPADSTTHYTPMGAMP